MYGLVVIKEGNLRNGAACLIDRHLSRIFAHGCIVTATRWNYNIRIVNVVYENRDQFVES